MIILECDQRSDEWRSAKRGILSGTGFSNILTPGGKKSASWKPYLFKLAAEALGDEEENDYQSEPMKRGIELEPEAIATYEFITGNKCRPVGLIYRDASKTTLVSPDSLTNEDTKGLELKCPALKTHLEYLWDNVVPSTYYLQVQGGLWVTGFKEWDFFSYYPGYKPLIVTATPNPVYQAALDKHVPLFVAELRTVIRKIKKG